MRKTELLDKYARDGDSRLLLARVLDQMERAQRRSIPCATQFLSSAQRAAAEPLLAEQLRYLKLKSRLPTGMERITELERDLAAQ